MAYSPDTRTAWGAPSATDAAALDQGLRAYMLRVYNWMTSGLVLTGAVAYAIAHTQLIGLFYRSVPTAFGYTRLQPTGLGIIAMLAPLGFVLALQFGVNRLSRSGAQMLYWAFCAAMGASLTNIFIAYTGTSIVRVFFITAGTFGAMSIWGYTTRSDLSRFGSFLMMGLIGVIIAMVVNMFLHSTEMQLIISVVGVLVFVGLTAYDTQRIKSTYVSYAYAMGQDGAAKRSVYDALSLYLNFVNLFTLLLQLMGNRNNN